MKSQHSISFYSVCFLIITSFLVTIINLFCYIQNYPVIQLTSDSKSIFIHASDIVSYLNHFDSVEDIVIYADILTPGILYGIPMGYINYTILNILLLIPFFYFLLSLEKFKYINILLIPSIALFIVIYSKEAVMLFALSLFVIQYQKNIKSYFLLFLAGLICFFLLETTRRGSGLLFLLFLLLRKHRSYFIFVLLSGLVSSYIFDYLGEYIFIFQRILDVSNELSISQPNYFIRLASNILFLPALPIYYKIDFNLFSQFCFGIWCLFILHNIFAKAGREKREYSFNLILLILLLSFIPFAHPRYLIAFIPLIFISTSNKNA